MLAPPSPALTNGLLALVEDIRQKIGSALLDVAIGYNTVLLIIDFSVIPRTELLAWLNTLPAPANEQTYKSKLQPDLTLPVYYGHEVAPDLEPLGAVLGITDKEIIELHSETVYFAYATGFAPGFCYLGDIDKRLQQPRRATPRPMIAAGSVAIAEQQTAIYPRSSPGGWHILGRCPLPLFDLTQSPPAKIKIGQWVQFCPIDRNEFLKLGGEL